MLIVPVHYLQIVAGNYILMPLQQNWPGLTIHQSVVWSQLNLPRGGGGGGGGLGSSGYWAGQKRGQHTLNKKSACKEHEKLTQVVVVFLLSLLDQRTSLSILMAKTSGSQSVSVAASALSKGKMSLISL